MIWPHYILRATTQVNKIGEGMNGEGPHLVDCIFFCNLRCHKEASRTTSEDGMATHGATGGEWL